MFVDHVIKRMAGIPDTNIVLGYPDWFRGCQELCMHLPEKVVFPIPTQADRVTSSLQRLQGTMGSRSSGRVVKRCG